MKPSQLSLSLGAGDALAATDSGAHTVGMPVRPADVRSRSVALGGLSRSVPEGLCLSQGRAHTRANQPLPGLLSSENLDAFSGLGRSRSNGW